MLHLNSRALLEHGLVDEIVPEPPGGAHRDPAAAATTLKQRLRANLNELKELTPALLLERRYNKFRNMGVFQETEAEEPLAEETAPDNVNTSIT